MTLVADAFEHFARSVMTSGLAITDETPQNARLLRVERDGAEMRLRWDEEGEFLSLQISHGPASQRAGWLNLYSAKCLEGELPQAADVGAGFEDSVDYGIELMVPDALRRKR